MLLNLMDQIQSVTCFSEDVLPLKVICNISQGSGFVSASFLAYITNLYPLNTENVYCISADDPTVLIHHHNTASNEIKHKMRWTANKVAINMNNTKGTVIC
jgi:hypothetical protein